MSQLEETPPPEEKRHNSKQFISRTNKFYLGASCYKKSVLSVDLQKTAKLRYIFAITKGGNLHIPPYIFYIYILKDFTQSWIHSQLQTELNAIA